jgi:hypothetical protein
MGAIDRDALALVQGGRIAVVEVGVGLQVEADRTAAVELDG